MESNPPPPLLSWKPSRRDFLRSTLTLGFISLKPSSLFGQLLKEPKQNGWGALVDISRCIGCRACSRACLAANNFPPEPQEENLFSKKTETLSWKKFSVVNAVGAASPDGAGQRFVKKQCMHCLEPACVSVCPVGALDKTSSGPVIYRADRCIGCRYCMVACPFDIPKFEWNSGLKPVIGKCEFCARQRIFEGKLPGCAEACPTGAIKFGKREALLFEARALIRSHPEKYVNHVYGEHEVGGTSWLYVSDVPFETLGFKTGIPSFPLPSLTWEVISRIPYVVAVLTALLGFLGVSLRQIEKKEVTRS